MSYVCGNGPGDFSTFGLASVREVLETDASGNPTKTRTIFQNAVPGGVGNVQSNNIYGPGRWTLDATMGKSIEFMEGKRIEIRVDAQNIFNHATPSYDMGIIAGFEAFASASYGARYKTVNNPNTTIYSGNFSPFATVNSKAGHRTFQGKLSIRF
jgi:hypothetical protein